MADSCAHLQPLWKKGRKAVAPSGHGCKECLADGAEWVHLRLCLDCGHVGCCDSSPNKHATKHFHSSGHPMIRSYEPGENWAFCYVDDVTVDEVPTLSGEAPARHYDPPLR